MCPTDIGGMGGAKEYRSALTGGGFEPPTFDNLEFRPLRP